MEEGTGQPLVAAGSVVLSKVLVVLQPQTVECLLSEVRRQPIAASVALVLIPCSLLKIQVKLPSSTIALQTTFTFEAKFD